MSRLMRSQGRVVQNLEMVRVDGKQIQPGSLNDPALQGGKLYFDAARTNYLYLDGVDIMWQPANGSAVKLN
jgi:hypothetical protein